MGVMGRANAGQGAAVGNGEPFLSKDELIRYRTPLAIVDIQYDRWGSRQYRNPRWVLIVEPWDANLPIPESAYPADQDADQPGIITFGDSEVRQNQFGTGRDEQGQPIGLSAQLEDARAQGLEWIGPVAVVSDRANSGQAFKTLADVKLDEGGAVVVDGRGFPVLEGGAQAEPARRQAPARAPAAAAAPPAAAPVRQARRSTGQRTRAAAAAAPPPPAVPATAPQAPAQAAAAAPAGAPPRVRRATTPATAPAAPPAQPPAQVPTAPRRRAAPTQQANPAQPAPQAPPAASPDAYERQVQQQEARQPGPSGPAPGVRELTDVTIGEATATCPFCQTEITGRLYPAGADAFTRFYAESARAFGWPDLTAEQKAAGGQVIAHPFCPMLQQTVMLPYVQFEEGE